MNNNNQDPINPEYYDEIFNKVIESKFSIEDRITINEFNAIKYLYRWRNKNGIQDLKKAIWYISEIIRYKEEQDKDNRQLLLF